MIVLHVPILYLTNSFTAVKGTQFLLLYIHVHQVLHEAERALNKNDVHFCNTIIVDGISVNGRNVVKPVAVEGRHAT